MFYGVGSMRGLALEGGGAKGAYHIGVTQALMENGYEFDGFVGTSIGALNAAMMAQGDFEELLELWQNLTMDKIFDRDILSKIISDKGIGTEKMRGILEHYIDEDKVRGSGKDFGLVTLSINDRKPYKLMLEDIPPGQLIDFIMASASLPGFKVETSSGASFLDGAFYDNCPYGLLCDKGYDEVIAIRTNAPGFFRKVRDARVKVISPRENLGPLLQISPKRSKANIRLGYYDGLRFVRGLRGMSYYILPVDSDIFHPMLMSLGDDIILGAGKVLGLGEMPAKRMLFEKIIPQLSAYLKLGINYDYPDFIIALLERAAVKRGIERFRIYNYEQLLELVNESPVAEKERKLSLIPESGILSQKKTAIELLTAGLLLIKS